jgi:hypothetical protein
MHLPLQFALHHARRAHTSMQAALLEERGAAAAAVYADT